MKLFIPGPVSVSNAIASTGSIEMIGHRSSNFKELMLECSQGLQRILFTKNRVLISTSSGSGLMEGAIRNCVDKDVLVCVCGAFGKKWASIARACGKNVDVLEVESGKAIQKKDLEDALCKKSYDAVCITMNETSTGVENNLDELVPIIKEKNALVLVDAVSCMCGSRINVGELKLDVCLASSQKCFGLPPGLSFASVSESALKKSMTICDKGFYFDFVELAKEYDDNQTPYTPAVGLFFALREQLRLIESEGIENRFNRHKKLNDITHSWVKENGFELFSDERYSSNTITCVKNTRRVDFSRVKKLMLEKGFFIDTGYRKMNEQLIASGKEDTFRIPHMGDLSEEELKEFLGALSETINRVQGD